MSERGAGAVQIRFERLDPPIGAIVITFEEPGGAPRMIRFSGWLEMIGALRRLIESGVADAAVSVIAEHAADDELNAPAAPHTPRRAKISPTP